MRFLFASIGALVLGLAAGPAAQAQDADQQKPAGQGMGQTGQTCECTGCPAGCPMHGQAGCPACQMGEGGCPMKGGASPMMKAREAGVTASVEETERGALVRIEAPRGDDAARDQARMVAHHIAKMMEMGCPAHGAARQGNDQQGAAP